MKKISMERLGVVLEPRGKEFKTVAKFNAGMAMDNGIVHMAYRFSVWSRHGYDERAESCYVVDDIRYACLTPEGKLIRDTERPLLQPSLPWDSTGCQDPRIIPFEGYFYLIYCGWDRNTAPAGKDLARVGFARTKDFKTCEKLGVIGHYTWDKDACIFPERINGKVAFMHRVIPNIQIDYFDSIEEMVDQRFWAKYDEKRCAQSTVMKAAYPWENGKVGGSLPPIKTDKGWLLIYHGVEDHPGQKPPFTYRAGAALLDLKNPSKVIARLPYPILEPETDYEKFGDVDNVVFPVGGYLHNGYLYMSYGGADRCVAMARTPLDGLLGELLEHKVVSC